MKNLLRTLLAGFLCLTLPVWGAYAAVPDFHPVFNGNAGFLPADEVSEGGLNLADLKFVQQEPEILNPGFLDSILGLTAPEETAVLQNLEEQLTDELYQSQNEKPFWLNGKVLVISGVVILLSGLAILIGVLAGSGGGSGSGSGSGSGGGVGGPQSLLSNPPGTGEGEGTGENENTGNQNENNPDPNDPNESNPGGGDGNTPPGGGSGGSGGGGGTIPFDGDPGTGNRSFPPKAPNNPEPGTMMLMLLGFCFPLLRKRFS